MSLLIPEVFADAINAKLDTTIRIGRVAFDATSLVPDILVAEIPYISPPLTGLQWQRVLLKAPPLILRW